MIASGFLFNPTIREWLHGIEPAWTMLESESLDALTQEPSATNQTIRLESNLNELELSGSAVTRTAKLLLQRATQAGGLKLTATGNLSRGVVAEMIEIIQWPDLDRNELYQLHKVINEPDFLPVHFVRVLLQGTKLVRAHKGKLALTRLGKAMLPPERYGALQALLFHIALWQLNMGYFDRNPIEVWPQTHTGVVLWSLSVSATDWTDRETLTRLCTVPIDRVVNSDWDLGSYAMESRILRPLTWFGLLEHKGEGARGSGEQRFYWKTPLFDRFVKFNVQIVGTATRH